MRRGGCRLRQTACIRLLYAAKEKIMEKFIVKGGRPLCGEVEIQSAKNAVLPLLAASVLTD